VSSATVSENVLRDKKMCHKTCSVKARCNKHLTEHVLVATSTSARQLVRCAMHTSSDAPCTQILVSHTYFMAHILACRRRVRHRLACRRRMRHAYADAEDADVYVHAGGE